VIVWGVNSEGSNGDHDSCAADRAIRQELHMQMLAAGHEGLIRQDELASIGFTPSGAFRRVRSGRLWRRYPGVFVVGQRELTQAGEFLAAVYAVGDGAALSWFAAAVHWGFWNWYGGPIDVTVARRVRSRPGVRVHNVRVLPPVTVHRGIPITTVEQTVIDLAGAMRSAHAFERLLHEALVQKTTDIERLREAVAGLRRRPPGLDWVLREIEDGPKPTRSQLEDRLVDLLRRKKFPPFETNAHPPGTPSWVEVDVLFMPQRLVVEIDGGRWHSTSFRRRFDARKRALLEEMGYRVLVLDEDAVTPALEAQTVTRIWKRLGS
jgi:very-short-patch-repair endonuclease